MNGVVFMRRKLRSSSHHISAFLFSPIRYRITTQGSRKALWYVSILIFPSFVEYADLYDQIPTPRPCSPPLLCPHLLCYFYCHFLVHSHPHHHNRKFEMTLPCCICRYRVSAFLFFQSVNREVDGRQVDRPIDECMDKCINRDDINTYANRHLPSKAAVSTRRSVKKYDQHATSSKHILHFRLFDAHVHKT